MFFELIYILRAQPHRPLQRPADAEADPQSGELKQTGTVSS